MGAAVEGARLIDIRSYAERYPHSELLNRLGETATNNQSAHYEGWWEQLKSEYTAGALPPDAAVAAYFSVIHPVDTSKVSEELGPEQARRLAANEKVVGYGFNNSFDPSTSGTLESDVTAELGHPITKALWYASVNLGLKFTDRRTIQTVFPAQKLYIGAAEISEEYDRSFAADKHTKADIKNGRVGSNVLAAAAIMQKLDLTNGEPRFEELRDLLINAALDTIQPVRMRQNPSYYPLDAEYDTRVVKLLPDLHTLAPSETEERIREFAKHRDLYIYEKELTDSVAQIRSPFNLESVTDLERQMWKHKAAAEIYEDRFEARQASGR